MESLKSVGSKKIKKGKTYYFFFLICCWVINMKGTPHKKGYKVCSTCGELKPSSEFYRGCVCDKCRAERAKRYYERNRKSMLVYQTAYHREHKGSVSRSCHKYYEKNRDIVKTRTGVYYDTNREQILKKKRVKDHEKRVEKCKGYVRDILSFYLEVVDDRKK